VFLKGIIRKIFLDADRRFALLFVCMAALLNLVGRLIDYGKELAATLHRRVADNPYFAPFNFGTCDLALILARITRGLQRAAALQERLTRLAARPERQPTPTKPAAERKPRAPRSASLRCDTLLTPSTTEEQIAADRRRPIGAVIADICRDLAILPSHPLWRELQQAIMDHGGSYIRLLKHVLKRNYQLAAELTAPPEPSSSLLPTGPP
jgi:hypothetical protein